MKTRITDLLQQSGFVLWENEAWGPGPHMVDWSSDYAVEMERFIAALVSECALIADSDTCKPYATYGERIKAHFGIK